jgi:hypothetical protein
LPFTSKRFKRGWLPSGVNQRDYVKSAVRLALRKDQVKRLKGSKQVVYQTEIDTLRGKIYKINFAERTA